MNVPETPHATHFFSYFIPAPLARACAAVATITSASAGMVRDLAIACISPKQSIRPDSFWSCVGDIMPYLQQAAGFRIWKIQSVFNNVIPINELESYLDMLSALNQVAENPETTLSANQKLSLRRCFVQATINREYSDKFDYIILSKNDSKLVDAQKNCKKLFQFLNFDHFTGVQTKFHSISRTLATTENEVPLKEQEKLNAHDCALFLAAPSMLKLAKAFASALDDNEASIELQRRWDFVVQVGQSAPFQNLQQVIKDNQIPGRILLGNLHAYHASSGNFSDLENSLMHLFQGKLCHIGVFVKQVDGTLGISHMNMITNSHAVQTIRNPLMLPQHYSIDLDINSLIPEKIDGQHRQMLIATFNETFQSLAAASHSEFPLSNWKQNLNMVIWGHKKLSSEDLSKMEFPPKNTPLMCSSYVGIIFLLAVKSMNEHIKRLGYSEQIPHPFGPHENLLNLDILRLLYLLKGLNVIKTPTVDPKIAKVMSQAHLIL